ncbi:uncharacterized protein LTR77_003267 [Saxophila tyrrhenica]|uniref:Uncharacterized protein n=1 Tax=Saxophila tyrrhenica TaxID=1690608 RepID=A0AAV9PLI6_9PEZI|nr:hypothetical protein LTR77_003267 [Saxophila tyrrhenica]
MQLTNFILATAALLGSSWATPLEARAKTPWHITGWTFIDDTYEFYIQDRKDFTARCFGPSGQPFTDCELIHDPNKHYGTTEVSARVKLVNAKPRLFVKSLYTDDTSCTYLSLVKNYKAAVTSTATEFALSPTVTEGGPCVSLTA